MPLTKRLVYATALWFIAILLMTLATAIRTDGLSGWAILAALGGCVPIVWLVVDHVVSRERQRTRDEIQDIARIVISEQEKLHSV